MTIRPFKLPADLDLMVSLIRDGFQYPENPKWSIQEDELQGMLDQLNGVKRIWFLVHILQILSPFFRNLLCGFIYEENGKPFGLINYMRQRKEPEWLIGNVTVLPASRRRGIARNLVEATIQDLGNRDARVAILDVVDGNVPAHTLYKNVGFADYTSSVQYDFRNDSPVIPYPLPEGYTITPLKNSKWKTIYQFAKRVTPESITRYEQISEQRFRIPLMMRVLAPLLDMLSGTRIKRFVAQKANGDVIGWGRCRYRVREGGMNNAEIQLDPGYPEQALPILSHILAFIQEASPGRRIEIRLQDWQPTLIEAAESLGCEKRLNFYRMGHLFSS